MLVSIPFSSKKLRHVAKIPFAWLCKTRVTRSLSKFSIFFKSQRIFLVTEVQMIFPKGDLWVQSPMIIVGQSPNIRSIAENRRRSPAIYRSVSSGYVHFAEHDGWHCRRRFAKVVLSSFARLK